MHAGKGLNHRGESDVVEGREVKFVAKGLTPAQSLGNGGSVFYVCIISKTMSPSKLGGNGDENNAPGSEVSPTKSFYLIHIKTLQSNQIVDLQCPWYSSRYQFIYNPNPNPNIRITKKTMTRRFVF